MKLGRVCDQLETVAPLHLAQSWDNVGLLAGDPDADCSSVLLTIDLTAAVLAEATAADTDLILAYHPPLFRPIQRLRADSPGTDALIYQAIRRNLAVFSVHTALDAAGQGTNDVLAELCGAVDLQPFEFVDEPRRRLKVVVFVPTQDVDRVAGAIFEAGGGVIGEYHKCSFRIPGTGTFQGSDQTSPHIGKAGRFETVNEIRLEVLVPAEKLSAVITALRRAHPYEEPAFDIYPLQPQPQPGIGRIGTLPEAITLIDLALQLKVRTPSTAPQVVGDTRGVIERVAVCVGAAGTLPLTLGLGRGDCVITGEIRHHDALSLARCGCSAVALGHWASERPVLQPLAERLRAELDGVRITISAADRDPFDSV